MRTEKKKRKKKDDVLREMGATGNLEAKVERRDFGSWMEPPYREFDEAPPEFLAKLSLMRERLKMGC